MPIFKMKRQDKKSMPFLKWPGSKYSVLDKIIKHIPPETEHLIEGFSGAGSLSLNVNCKKHTLIDANHDLIHMFKLVVRNASQFIFESEKHIRSEHNNIDSYIALRQEYNEERNPDHRAVLLHYLLRHSFNGLIRYNLSGGFNVPFGKYQNVKIPTDKILNFAEKLQHANFIAGDFFKVIPLLTLGENAVVYLDPPYVPLSKTSSFTSYSQPFNIEHQHLLNDTAVALRSRAYVLISNSDTTLTRTIYKDAQKTTSYLAKRTISRDGSNRKPAKELLFHYSRNLEEKLQILHSTAI